jgi:PKD repeat protein
VIAAAFILLALVLPALSGADTASPVVPSIVPPLITGSGDLLDINATFPPISVPPSVFITGTETDQLTTTVYGTVIPGTVNTTIDSIRWDWGDASMLEDHPFPHSHTYAEPGIYTVTVTAVQSDGQAASRTRTVSTGQAIIPEVPVNNHTITVPVLPAIGPGTVAGSPVLTLLEPVIDGMNVTVNGNLNPGGPGVVITSVTIEWDDGNLSLSADLPATHRYPQSGIYTVNITGNQSDGQSVTKGITVNIRDEDSPPPGPSSAPPGDQSLFLIILVTAISVAVVGALAQRVFQKRREAVTIPDIPKGIAIEEETYYQAKERGDPATAAASAHNCARMFRSQAERFPEKRLFFLEMAEIWDIKARNADLPGSRDARSPKTVISPDHLPSPQDLEQICSGTDVAADVLDAVIRVAVEIAREGREGQAVGTSFVVGDTAAVMARSRQFVLNPFKGHREEERRITEPGISGNIKEFAQLDGAFIVSGAGIVEAAGRYITVDMSTVKLAEGLGSRHSSIAGITQVSNSIGIVVSQSGGLISIFKRGAIVFTIGS